MGSSTLLTWSENLKKLITFNVIFLQLYSYEHVSILFQYHIGLHFTLEPDHKENKSNSINKSWLISKAVKRLINFIYAQITATWGLKISMC